MILNSLELLTKNLTALVVRCSVQPEFEYYHSLLLTHGEGLIEKFKETLFAARYDDNSRVLEFGSKSKFNKTLEMFEDGTGGILIKTNGAPYVETINSVGGVTVTIG